MTTMLLVAGVILVGVLALAAAAERRRRADYGRLSRRQLLKYKS